MSAILSSTLNNILIILFFNCVFWKPNAERTFKNFSYSFSYKMEVVIWQVSRLLIDIIR